MGGAGTSGDPTLGWAPVGLLPCLMRTEVFSPLGLPCPCVRLCSL